jgi:CheY-like chemotaxis protein
VDPDEAWLAIIARQVEQTSPPMDVLRFTHIFDALEYAREIRVDAIVADVHLPQMEGLLFTEAIREFDSNIPVVLVSVNDALATEAQAAGATAFLPKRELRAKLVSTLQRLTASATT